VPFEDRGGYFQGRYYQDITVKRVLLAIANGQDRILLTLATGTGKTFIAFQLAWKLFQKGAEKWQFVLYDFSDVYEWACPSTSSGRT